MYDKNAEHEYIIKDSLGYEIFGMDSLNKAISFAQGAAGESIVRKTYDGLGVNRTLLDSKLVWTRNGGIEPSIRAEMYLDS